MLRSLHRRERPAASAAQGQNPDLESKQLWLVRIRSYHQRKTGLSIAATALFKHRPFLVNDESLERFESEANPVTTNFN
jgi:hypothetical protein